MSHKNILKLFAIGVVLISTGIVFKFSKNGVGTFLLIMGLCFHSVALVLLLVRAFKKPKDGDNFMDT